jgi:hypothetical protein
MKVNVFLSYSRADKSAAGAIADLLRRRGIGCWVDERGIRPGQRYDREIEQAIRHCDAVVWLVSPEALKSDYVKYEVVTALHRRKPVLPVRLEAIDLAHLPAPLNLKLGNVQGWDYFASPAEGFGEGLAEGLVQLVRHRRRARARLPVAAVGALALLVGLLGLWWAVAHGRKAEVVVPPVHPIPPRVTGLPFADVMRIIYTESPPAPPSGAVRAALQLGIEARRQGEPAFVPLKDGESLASRVDDYRVMARALSPGHLYIFQVDATGRVDWLFPHNRTTPVSHGTNPLAAGAAARIPSPESPSSLYLDNTVGFEHVYAVFSATRWLRLEDALSRPAPAGWPEGDGSTRGVVEAPVGLGLRGVGGVRTDAPVGTAPSGDRFQGDGYFLVLERWFRHVEPG